MKKKTLNIKELCLIGLTTTIICIMAPLSIPMPLGVPMTMQTFIIMIVAIVLGAKRGATATLLYILLGAFGLPVFSNFTGGWQVLVGPTGGFILSFPIMAYLIGLGSDYRFRTKVAFLIGIIAGNLTNLAIGTFIFCLIGNTSLLAGLTACVLPFLPITIIKIFLSWSLGLKIKSSCKS